MHQSLFDAFEAGAARQPDRIAIVEGRTTLTYREVSARIAHMTHKLRERGVHRGDRVVICAGNRVETVVAFWAALAAGGITVVIGPEQSAAKLHHVLTDSGARVMIATSEVVERLSGKPSPSIMIVDDETATEALAVPNSEGVEVISEDLAALIYTSGSTGDAKGVMLSHGNMLAALASLNEYLENTADDVFLCVLPLAFDYGLYQMIMAFSVGATLVLQRDMSAPIQVIKDIEKYSCTVIPGVPLLFELIERFSRFGMPDVSSVRCLTNTGAALLPRHIDTIQRLFPGAAIYSMYGVTECKRCTYLPPHLIDAKPASVGIAIPNTEIMVLDDEGRPCTPFAVGQLVVRGGTVMQGYWGLPEETARKIRTHPVRGGRCLYTGDYGYLDEDGHFYFKGRMDDVIKVRGRKLIPRDIEDVLRAFDGIADAAVIVTTLPDGTHDTTAILEARSVDLDELHRHCRRELENFQLPHRFELVDRLPRNTNGKVDKLDLGRRYPAPAAEAVAAS